MIEVRRRGLLVTVTAEQIRDSQPLGLGLLDLLLAECEEWVENQRKVMFADAHEKASGR